MASRVPHFSGKSIGRVPREYVAVVLVGVAAALLLLFNFPMQALVAVSSPISPRSRSRSGDTARSSARRSSGAIQASCAQTLVRHHRQALAWRRHRARPWVLFVLLSRICAPCRRRPLSSSERSGWPLGRPPLRQARSRSQPVTARTPMCPPPPPKVHVAQPLQQPVTLYLELTGNTAPFNSVDLVARVQGYLKSIDYKDGACGQRRERSCLASSATLSGAARSGERDAGLQSGDARVQHRPNISGRRRSASRISPARRQCRSGSPMQDQAAAQVLNAKAAIETRQDQSRLYERYSRRSTASSPTISSTSARWSECRSADQARDHRTARPDVRLFQCERAAGAGDHAEATPRPASRSGRRTCRVSRSTSGCRARTGYPHKGHMDYASRRSTQSTGTLTARALFDNKDQGAAARPVRARSDAGRPSGQGCTDAKRRDRDEPGGQLCAGGRPGQCRSAQDRENRRP